MFFSVECSAFISQAFQDIYIILDLALLFQHFYGGFVLFIFKRPRPNIVSVAVCNL